MADEAIGDAAEATAAEGGVVVLAPNPEAEAAEQSDVAPVEAPPVESEIVAEAVMEDTRLADLEARVLKVELGLTEVSSGVAIALENKADAAHEHPIPEDMRIIAEELQTLADEEMAPRRGRLPQRGWLARKLRGQDGR